MKKLPFSKIIHKAARVIIEDIDINQKLIYMGRLEKTMGLQNATIMVKIKPDIYKIKEVIKHIIEPDKFDTFRVTTKRQNKKFKYTSPEINIIIGDYIRKHFNKSVSLNHSDVNFIIEILIYQ